MIKRLKAALGIAPKRRSSPEISSLASDVLHSPPMSAAEAGLLDTNGYVSRYNQLLREAKRLAGSVLSQDEIPG